MRLSCGFFAHKVHGSNKGNQFECILLSTLSLHHSIWTAEGVIILLRKTGSLSCHWSVGFIGWVLCAWLKLLPHTSSGNVWFWLCLSCNDLTQTHWPVRSFSGATFCCKSDSRLANWSKKFGATASPPSGVSASPNKLKWENYGSQSIASAPHTEHHLTYS